MSQMEVVEINDCAMVIDSTGAKRSLEWLIRKSYIKAIKENNILEVKRCLSLGIPVDTLRINSGTPLHIAVENGRLEIVISTWFTK